MPVGIRVVAGEDVVVGALRDEGGHRRRRRRIHADLLVPVQRHEPPGRVDVGVHDGQVQAVVLADQSPVLDGGPAERVSTDPHPGALDRLDVDDAAEVAHVPVTEVVLPERVGVDVGEARAGDARQAPGDQLVRAVGDPAGRVGVGRSAVGRVVLEPAVARRVVRWGHHDAVGAARVIERPAAVVGEDRVAERRSRHPRVAGVDAHVHTVRDEHLDGAALRRQRQPVRVAAEEQGPADALGLAVVDDRLRGGEDVVLIEARAQR